MTLSERIQLGATRANRHRKEAAGKRIDEIGAVTDIAPTYQAVDRAGDLAIESKFQELYCLVDTEEEKQAIAAAFAVWQRTERAEDLAVTGAVNEAADVLRGNNDFWLGAYVPDGDGGAA